MKRYLVLLFSFCVSSVFAETSYCSIAAFDPFWYCASSEEASCHMLYDMNSVYHHTPYKGPYDGSSTRKCYSADIITRTCPDGEEFSGGYDHRCRPAKPKPPPEPEFECKANLRAPMTDLEPPVAAIPCKNEFYNYKGCLAVEDKTWDSGANGVFIGVMCVDGDTFCTGHFKLTGATTSCSMTTDAPNPDPKPDPKPDPEPTPDPEPEPEPTPDPEPEGGTGGGGTGNNGSGENGTGGGGGGGNSGTGGSKPGGSNNGQDGGEGEGEGDGEGDGNSSGTGNGSGNGKCDPLTQECGTDDKSSAGGTACDQALTCKGDAIQCAQLVKQKQIQCAQEELYTLDANKRQKLNDTVAKNTHEIAGFGDKAADNIVDVSGLISKGSSWLPRSCPAPVHVDVLGQGLQLSFSPICDIAGWFSGVILAIASFLAIRVFVRG